MLRKLQRSVQMTDLQYTSVCTGMYEAIFLEKVLLFPEQMEKSKKNFFILHSAVIFSAACTLISYAVITNALPLQSTFPIWLLYLTYIC